MGLINLGLTGIHASQAALDTTGHNITNANTPGYTRQRVEQSANTPRVEGSNIIGQGVKIDEIARIYNQFINDQILRDTSSFYEYDTHLESIQQVDKLISQSETSILNELSDMFDAFQTLADDPSSSSVRSTVLNDIEDVVIRFNQLSARLEEQQLITQDQIENSVTEVNALVGSIAALNKQILEFEGGSSAAANDLLDQRDQAVRQLSEFMSVRVVEESSGAVNVFLSGGQNLVVGTIPYELEVTDNEFDRTQKSISVNVNGNTLGVDSQISGGILSGLLDFQNETLSKSLNELGRVAIAIADQMNDQHRQGIDLSGQVGGFIFTDVNDMDAARSRFISSSNNATPNDRVGNVTILDSSVMTADDYIFEFTGPGNNNYQVRRVSDDSVVTQGVLPNGVPTSIEFEGISVNLESGSFQAGDDFLIRPTRLAASEIDREITRGDELALASPIRTGSNIGNIGTAQIDEGSILDLYEQYPNDTTLLSTFATAGALAPPVIIKFTSETTYDILDNSNPANPVSLVPPIEDQVYIPGVNNPIFPDDPGVTIIETTGANIGQVVAGTTNGYGAENLTFTFTDPDTGAVTVRPTVAIPANATAQDMVNILNQQDGVEATARSTMFLSNFVDDAAGAPLEIVINGETLVISPPDTVNADTVAAQINADANLNLQNIRAYSDGSQVRIESYIGVDLTVTVNGTAGDSVDVTDSSANTLTVVGPGNSATIGGTVDVQLADGLQMNSDNAGGLFAAFPVAQAAFMGYQVNINGAPSNDDTFTVDFNTDSVSDNRNGIGLIDLQQAKSIATDGKGLTFGEAYAGLASEIGADTQSLSINKDAAESVMNLSVSLRESISGVNLDEEAANLIKYELQYNASAQVIQVAQEIFDALIAAFR
ncbi:flagellar hook-associated protein FlgK [Litoribrevibacter euphylliae]|uniref:Flagellar hook-associated protein 1 n=1 Tax=Litoribrevibacter euphylliae TaxID=1834034 RepID=A0ABV7HBL0_9GAMM